MSIEIPKCVKDFLSHFAHAQSTEGRDSFDTYMDKVIRSNRRTYDSATREYFRLKSAQCTDKGLLNMTRDAAINAQAAMCAFELVRAVHGEKRGMPFVPPIPFQPFKLGNVYSVNDPINN